MKTLLAATMLLSLLDPLLAQTAQGGSATPLIVHAQGSFAVGGTVIRNGGTFDQLRPSSEGQTHHGDHAYVFYQVPVNARRLPLVLWHGAGQSSKTWETTPDGREGYQPRWVRTSKHIFGRRLRAAGTREARNAVND
jgi:hypothetical protein